MSRRGSKVSCGRVSVAVVAAVLMAAAWPATAADAPERALAREILQATGVKGGLVVHVGCGDPGAPGLTAALRASEAYLVHGLDADAGNVETARALIRKLGLYGKASAERWSGKRLPYADNLVNLLVSERPLEVPPEEVLRVLVPNGVAYVRQGDKWSRTVKPRPKQIDEWTHYLHDPSNNAVSHDSVVAPPRHLQWVGSPRWARHHDHMASMSALVATGGRIFYIIDEGPKSSIQLPPQWRLAARDAFNGTVLWQRPISSWYPHLWPLKSGHAQLPRRLVALGDRVYVTLGLDEPLSQLDAATGEILQTYKDTKATEEAILSDGVLFLLVGYPPTKDKPYHQIFSYCWDETARANRGWAWDEKPRTILAVKAETGQVLWRKRTAVAPLTLAADGRGVFFHDGEKVVCLDRATGAEKWASAPVKRRTPIPTCFGPTLVVYQDVVLFSGGDRTMSALSAGSGKTLWTAKHPRSGHQSPEDLLVVGDLVWAGEIANGQDSGVFTGRDPHTGEVKVEFPPDVKTYWFHHRCYRSKATDRYILPSRTGIEFVDFQAKHWEAHHWVRGGCLYGIMPCNGMVYAPPHSCACYLESKLYGFNALTPAEAGGSRDEGRGEVEAGGSRDEGQGEAEAGGSGDEGRAEAPGRLEKGPAYEVLGGPGPEAGGARGNRLPARRESIANRQFADWPTYRHDPARSGATGSSVAAELKPAWQADLGGTLSSVVVAGGKLFVASVDTHAVYALDAGTGKVAWCYTAGGRVDSPPTIWRGRAIFGSADGWVYCLRADDGALAWRFRAAPQERRVMAFEQLESAWPVHGSVLVHDCVAYCVAGRSMFLDGGLHLLRLDPATGRKLSEVVLDDRDPESGKNLQAYVKGLDMPVALPDVLSTDGRYLYMRSQRFDLAGNRSTIAPENVAEQVGEGMHLFSTIGFLDGSWFHRSYTMFGRATAWGWGGWFRAGRYVPAGRLLVADGSGVYGYGRKPEYMCQSSVLGYELFAAQKGVTEQAIRRVTRAAQQMNADANKPAARNPAPAKAPAKKPAKKGKNVAAADWRFRQRYPTADLTATQFRWTQDQPPLHVRAMVLADKTLFIAGPPNVVDEKESFSRPDDPAVRAKLAEQAAALDGHKGALLWAVAATDGQRLAEYKLLSPPAWDGMAAAGGRLFLSTMDGKVQCWAPGP